MTSPVEYRKRAQQCVALAQAARPSERAILLDIATVRRKLFQYHLVMLAEAQQSAACNAKHVVHSRLCRWLLRSHFLIRSDTLHLTQEFIAQMLGVRRTSVTFFCRAIAIGAGIIKHRRGLIEIINVEALQDSSCECYEAIVAQRQLVLGQT